MKFDIPAIKTGFKTLNGFRESANEIEEFDELTADLKTSDSGVYYNDIPGIKLNSINEMIESDNIDINDYLTESIEASIVDLISQFTQIQKRALNAKTLLSDLNIGVRQATNIRDLTTKRNRFVGFELKPHSSNNIVVQPTHLGVQFDTAQAITIYLYSSSQIDPIQTFEITTTKGNTSLEWFELPETFKIEYLSDTYGVGDKYWIGYYESDLAGNALETRMPCGSCSNSPRKKYSKFVSINPIEVNEAHTYLSKEVFDIDDVGYTTETFGLHLRMNVDCDITKLLIENKELFATALQKKLAIKLFWDAFSSNRLNRETLLSKEDSRLSAEKNEIDLENELKTISIDFTSVDSVCLPCKKNMIRNVRLY